MLELSSEILTHVSAGGTLLVPSRQRAAAVRLAYAAAMLASGRQVWATPDVLPWSSWIERELDRARAQGQPLPRRLKAAEERLLWQRALRAASNEFDVLMPEALVDSVRRALAALDDYALPLHTPSSPESTVLLAARAHFDAQCTQLRVLGRASWRTLGPDFTSATPLLWAGFGSLGAARHDWLERIGARSAEKPLAATRSVRVEACADPAAEAEAAASWCAQCLATDPTARLLIVVPRLAEQRALWQRALSWRLDAAAWMVAADDESLFALEGGMPLADYPLVHAALQLLALGLTAEPGFAAISEVLRAAYFPALARDACLRLDLWLREQSLELVQGPPYTRLTAAIGATGPADSAVRACWQRLLEALEPLLGGEAVRTAAQWAQGCAAALAHCGWDAPLRLDSGTAQVRMRFDELLGELAAIGVPAAITRAEAGAWLQRLAASTAFEAASDDVPVTVTASVEDPVVRYDGIWVAGLTADVWPPAARPDALIPLVVQRAASMPDSSPALATQRATEQFEAWLRSGRECVLSWPRTDADLPCDPSPALRSVGATAEVARPAAATVPLDAWLAEQAPPLESWLDPAGPAWPRQGALTGGVRLLELQSLCPFRSFAELRLGAAELGEPEPGIDPRLRGQILHRALELLWRAFGDLQTLRTAGRPAAAVTARRVLAQAIDEACAMPGAWLPPALLRTEHARDAALLERLIEWELSRAPFAVQALEGSHLQPIAGATLRLRLDRVDRLEDGRLLVIDYKSGAAQSFDADAERPPQPQLPAYALVAGADVAAVAALYLEREALKVRGVADRPGRLPRLPALAEPQQWEALQRRWGARLERLVQEFLAGHATVEPQSGACEYCGLQMLCRVTPEQLAAGAPTEDADQDAARAERAIVP